MRVVHLRGQTCGRVWRRLAFGQSLISRASPQESIPRPFRDLTHIRHVDDRLVKHEREADQRCLSGFRLCRRCGGCGRRIAEVYPMMYGEGLNVDPANFERGFVVDDVPCQRWAVKDQLGSGEAQMSWSSHISPPPDALFLSTRYGKLAETIS